MNLYKVRMLGMTVFVLAEDMQKAEEKTRLRFRDDGIGLDNIIVANEIKLVAEQEPTASRHLIL